MKISKEVKKLSKRIEKNFDKECGPIEHLTISFEYNKDTGYWFVCPVYECSGDGHPQYMNSSFSSTDVLQGKAKNIVLAIKALKKIVRCAEKQHCKFYEW